MRLRWSDNLSVRPMLMDSSEFNPSKRAYPFVDSFISVDEPPFIEVDGSTVIFHGQCGPTRRRGVNGCQIDDMITFALGTLHMLNKKFPCRENSLAITKLEECLHWLDARKQDRESRGVEGKDRE